MVFVYVSIDEDAEAWEKAMEKYELPDVYDIAIEHYGFGLDTLQVLQQFFSMTTVCSQVNVREDNDIYFPFCHMYGVR